MSRIAVVQSVSVSPSAAWKLVGDPSGFAAWHPAVTASPTEGDARTCHLADGAQIRERILAHDDGAMHYTYEITDGPLPVANYRSTLAVEPSAEGCVLRWTSEFEPLGPSDEIEGMLRGLYAAGLEAARAHLEA